MFLAELNWTTPYGDSSYGGAKQIQPCEVEFEVRDPTERPFAVHQRGQKADKNENGLAAGTANPLISLVAGPGFEPGTFGL